MHEQLSQLLDELERYGRDNDRSVTDRSLRMLNITRETGELLSVLVRSTYAKRVLEIGTSNGYSTLWLAEAVRSINGSVTTAELAANKILRAAENFQRAGLTDVITQLHDDARNVLADAADESYDLIFLDAERPEYPGYWQDIKRVLRRGGLLVVDNAMSHVEQMKPFVELVEADRDFATCLVPVGNGEFLATRAHWQDPHFRGC